MKKNIESSSKKRESSDNIVLDYINKQFPDHPDETRSEEQLRLEKQLAKKKFKEWDGSWSEAYQPENFVADFINYGRFYREPTVDGYTHDLVERDRLLVENYYFPLSDGVTRKNGKNHMHYELYSNGEVRINGKRLTGFSDQLIEKQVSQEFNALSQLYELGDKFESDMELLNTQIKNIQKSDRISETNKQDIIARIEQSKQEIQQQYEREVTQLELQIHKKIEEMTSKIQEKENELKKDSEELQDVTMDVAQTDLSKAAEVAEEKRLELEKERLRIQLLLKEQAELSKSQKKRINFHYKAK